MIPVLLLLLGKCGPGHVILPDNQLLILRKYYLIVDSETHKDGTTNIHSVGSMFVAGPEASSAELVQISYRMFAKPAQNVHLLYSTPFVIYNGVNKNLARNSCCVADKWQSSILNFCNLFALTRR